MLPKIITLKIVGKTVLTTINRKSLKVNLEKDGKDKLKSLIEKFNKKPSEFLLNRILKTFEVKKVVDKAKAAKKIEKKAVKTIKKEKSKATKVVKAQEEVIATVATVVSSVIDSKKVEELTQVAEKAQPPINTGRRFGGEY